MRRTYAYFISLLLITTAGVAVAQDSIPSPRSFPSPRSIRIGGDIYGPLYHIYDKNNLTIEGFLSVDIDTGKAVVVEAGKLQYEYSQYNYDYKNSGTFFRAGMDFNLLKPENSLGKYYAGIGLRYGLSIYDWEVPSMKGSNYWGTVENSIPLTHNMAHFVEILPGIRTELFRFFEIGWTVRLRFLVYSDADKNLKPIYIPGLGNATKTFSPGINYYLIIKIPYRK